MCVCVHALLDFACIDAGMRCVSAQLLTLSILSPVQKSCLSPPVLPGSYISEASTRRADLDSYGCPQQGGNISFLHEECLKEKGAGSG